MVIIVFGVSGVGKTMLCASFVEKRPDFVHIQASKLLGASDRLSLASRSSECIINDQMHLVKAFHNLKAQLQMKSILLDAHSVVRGNSGDIMVPTKVVEDIGPSLLIFLRAAPEVIINRRNIRMNSSLFWTCNEVEQDQSIAQKAVELYSRDLSIPLSIIDVTQSSSLEAAIP